MILSELKTYLSERKRAPIKDMAIHFNSEPSAIRGMLEHFIRKGQVHRLEMSTACGGCQKCGESDMEIYEFKQS